MISSHMLWINKRQARQRVIRTVKFLQPTCNAKRQWLGTVFVHLTHFYLHILTFVCYLLFLSFPSNCVSSRLLLQYISSCMTITFLTLQLHLKLKLCLLYMYLNNNLPKYSTPHSASLILLAVTMPTMCSVHAKLRFCRKLAILILVNFQLYLFLAWFQKSQHHRHLQDSLKT